MRSTSYRKPGSIGSLPKLGDGSSLCKGNTGGINRPLVVEGDNDTLTRYYQTHTEQVLDNLTRQRDLQVGSEYVQNLLEGNNASFPVAVSSGREPLLEHSPGVNPEEYFPGPNPGREHPVRDSLTAIGTCNFQRRKTQLNIPNLNNNNSSDKQTQTEQETIQNIDTRQSEHEPKRKTHKRASIRYNQQPQFTDFFNETQEVNGENAEMTPENLATQHTESQTTQRTTYPYLEALNRDPGTTEIDETQKRHREIALLLNKQNKQTNLREKLKKAIKFVITNTGDCTAQDIWIFLHYHLNQAQTHNIYAVHKVQNLHRRPRFDMMVSPDIAAGISKLVHLTYKDRKDEIPHLFSRKTKQTWEKDENPNDQFSTKAWRIYQFKEWRDLPPKQPNNLQHTTRKAKGLTSLIAWNSNGFNNKSSLLNNVVNSLNGGVIIVGEHLRHQHHYEPKLEGFRTYTHPAKAGFRGLCTFVRHDLGAYEKPFDNPNIQHIVVTGIDKSSQWNIFGVYLQSGSNNGKTRKTQLKPIWARVNELLDKDPDAKIAIGGDFNTKTITLAQEALQKTQGRMTIKPCCGSDLTRLPKRGTPSDIDHWIISPSLTTITCKAKVNRHMSLQYNGTSDHATISMKIRNNTNPKPTPPRHIWRKNLLKGNSFELLTHDKWAEVDENAPLNELADKWHSTLEEAAKNIGIMQTQRPKRESHCPRKISKLLKKERIEKEKYLNIDQPACTLQEIIRRAKIAHESDRRATIAIRKYEKEETRKKEVQTLNSLRSNDMLTYHADIQASLNDAISKKCSQPTPCYDKKGKLCVTNKDIAKAEFEHFSKLAKDSTGVSQNPDTWETLIREDESVNCGYLALPFTPQEMLKACSRMNKNATPGFDNLPPNIFKEILRQERSQFIGLMNEYAKNDEIPGLRVSRVIDDDPRTLDQTEMIVETDDDGNIHWKWTPDNELLAPIRCKPAPTNGIQTKAGLFYEPLDYIYHPVPTQDMFTELATPAGKYALQILNRTLTEGQPPDRDTKNVVVSLNKPGKDPTNLTNRRGITLSTAFMKLTMTMLEDRISTTLNNNQFLTSDQGGFRRKEEGMGQFLSLTEVIRRRANNDKPTFALFIDFQKAFPSVPHEALWKKLRHMGIPEPIIKLLDNTYKTSSFKMKVGDTYSSSYPMEIGTKEGCPLSPLLFIIFINDLFNKLPGVRVPGINTDNTPYYDKGKLYADDAAAFFDTIEDAQRGCDIITQWVEKWQTLKVGHAKCAIVMFGEKDEEKRQNFLNKYGDPNNYPHPEKEHFKLTSGKVYAQASYVYLGIPIGQTLGIGYDEELTYAKNVAKKVRQKIGQYSSLFKDKSKTIAEKSFLLKTYVLSIALYGGEWIGMNQARTSIIQKEINKGLYAIMGLPWKTKDVDPIRLSWELSIPTRAVACASARHRIHAKSASMMTDASDILLGKYQIGKAKTWGSITRAETGKAVAALQRSIEIHHKNRSGEELEENEEDKKKPILIPIMIIEGLKAQHAAYPKKIPKTWVTINREKDASQQIKEERLAVQAYQWAKEMAASQDKYQHKASDYEYSKFGLTRNFLKTTLYQPHLKKGILMLVKARMNILIPTTTKEYETNMTIQKPICPLCKEQRKNDVLGEESEIAHILINCKSLIEKRDKHLTNIIQKLTRGVKQKNDISITTAEEKVAELLLGGECKSYLPHKDKQIEMMETRGIDEGFLLSW